MSAVRSLRIAAAVAVLAAPVLATAQGPGPGPGGPQPGPGIATPLDFHAKVLKVELSPDAENCLDPVTVFEHDGDVSTAPWSNLSEGGDMPIGFGDVPVGNYECVILTMGDTLKYTGPVGEADCDGSEVLLELPMPGLQWGVEESFTFYVSTAGTVMEGHNGTYVLTPPGLLLEAPLTVTPSGATATLTMDIENTIGPGCEMNEAAFGFEVEEPPPVPVGLPDEIEPPLGCQPEAEIRDDCSHSHCGWGDYQIIAGSYWSTTSWPKVGGEDGETCSSHCIQQWCQDYNGAWKTIFCFPPC